MQTVRFEYPPENWNDYVHNSINSNVYQTAYWGEIIKTGLNLKPIYYLVENDGKAVGGILLFEKKATRLGMKQYSSYSEPFFLDEKIQQQITTELIDKILEDMKKEKIVVFKLTTSSFWDREDVLNKYDFIKRDRMTFVIDLSLDKEVLWKNLEKKARWCVRKAKESGTVIEMSDERGINELYNMYSATRERLGISGYPFQYYKNLLDILGPKGMIKIFFVKYGEEVGGGILVVTFKNIIIELCVANSPNHMSNYPGDFLKWHVIEWGKDNGFGFYDLSGVEPNPKEGTKEYDIFRFKRKWGGQQKVYHSYYKYGFLGKVADKLKDKLHYKLIKPWD